MIRGLTMRYPFAQRGAMTRWGLIGMAMATGGCVNVSAPDKPIEININVTQQVVYRLDNQAKSLIQQNPGIF